MGCACVLLIGLRFCGRKSLTEFVDAESGDSFHEAPSVPVVAAGPHGCFERELSVSVY